MFNYFRNCSSSPHRVCCADSPTKGLDHIFSVRWPCSSPKVTTASLTWQMFNLCYNSHIVETVMVPHSDGTSWWLYLTVIVPQWLYLGDCTSWWLYLTVIVPHGDCTSQWLSQWWSLRYNHCEVQSPWGIITVMYNHEVQSLRYNHCEVQSLWGTITEVQSLWVWGTITVRYNHYEYEVQSLWGIITVSSTWLAYFSRPDHFTSVKIDDSNIVCTSYSVTVTRSQKWSKINLNLWLPSLTDIYILQWMQPLFAAMAGECVHQKVFITFMYSDLSLEMCCNIYIYIRRVNVLLCL